MTPRGGFRLWLLGAAAVAVLAFAVPKVLISDGLDGLSRTEREVAEEALVNASTLCVDNPIGEVLTRRIRVKEVRGNQHRCPDTTGPLRGYLVVMQTYTFFGIPADTIRVCGGHMTCVSELASGTIPGSGNRCAGLARGRPVRKHEAPETLRRFELER